MKCRCSACNTEFVIQTAIRGDHNWMMRAISEARDLHEKASPGCRHRSLVITHSGAPLFPA